MATWNMYAMRSHHPERGVYYQHVYEDARAVALWPGGKKNIVPVLVTEDPDGEYWGWLQEEHHSFLSGPYVRQETDFPGLIQPTRGMFTMQFPYGPQAEQDARKGEVVRLTIVEITE